MRAFNWVCNLLVFMCTCCIILLERYAVSAIYVLIGTLIAQVTGNGARKLYWKGYYLGYDYADALYVGNFFQMQWYKLRHWCMCKKGWKIKPVLASTRADNNSRDEDEEYTSGSDEEDEPKEHNSGARHVDESDIDTVEDNIDDEGFEDIDDLDDKYLPRIDSAVDSFITSHVGKVLKRQVTRFTNTLRRGDSIKDISEELSKVACRGRLSAVECAKVLRSYGNDMITLRFRTKEVSEDLDKACKIADRKHIKKKLVRDTIYGLGFCDEGTVMGRPEEEEEEEEEKSWSGLDAFRHVLEDEIQEPEPAYDAILHSILNMSTRDPG